MNIFKRAYCRTFQFALKLALPVLPYKNPRIENSIEQIPEVLKEQGDIKPLLVTDATIKKLGLTKRLEEALTANKMRYAVYDKVVANPTTQNVEEALALYKEEGCDSLIAFGGGSPMDCAKAVGALIARPKKKLGQLKGILKVRKKIPYLIAVPTTAGTGSETTLASVIVDSNTRHKYAINDFPLIPKCAVLDGQVTASLPKSVVATTGMDALTHAIEAYIGRGGNRSTRTDALEAAKLIFENIENSFATGDSSARQKMLIASHKAGRAFSKAYVGYVHALAHALGGRYDTPHGLANAVILPIVLKEYGSKVYKKLKSIAVYCGFADSSDPEERVAKELITRIENLNYKLGIPSNFDFIKKEDVDGLVRYAEKEANPLYPVPVLWDREKLKKLYLIVGGLKLE